MISLSNEMFTLSQINNSFIRKSINQKLMLQFVQINNYTGLNNMISLNNHIKKHRKVKTIAQIDNWNMIKKQTFCNIIKHFKTLLSV